MQKPLNTDSIADEVLVNAPNVTAAPAMALPVATVDVTPAQPALYDDATSQRHGRVASRSINLGFKNVVGEELDADTATTLGDVLGELFGLASRHVNRLVYILMLALCVLPLIAVVVVKVLKTEGDKPRE